MANKLYIGNLSYNTTEEDLRELFSSYGTINSLNIISDRDTGRPKGFGFIEMSTADEAKAAIAGLNSREVDGRQIKVNEANDRPPRQGGGRW
ncbi:MAG TPA: RNA-binding protein [Spirochaetia bacterium]|nr:RNA-binding protein [Spirochaetia bacterium]